MYLGLLAVVVGVAVLAKAADQFVEGAAGIARLLKVSPIVIGAVIIGFGTSAPEMIVSGIAAFQGDDDLGVGNIIGSNIANLSLILGAAAVMIPLRIDSSVLRREAPLATGAAIIFALLVQGGVSTLEGLALVVVMAIGLYLLMTGGNGDEALLAELDDDGHDETATIGGLSIRTVLGLVGTVGGAWVLVWGATTIAGELGLNDGFVGVTLVAVGTSLPELVTAIIAAKAGHDELIVGNLLGSNLFNSLGVGAVIGLLGDGELVDPSLAGLDTAFMLVVCVGAFLAMFTRRKIDRMEGYLLLAVFVGFIALTYINEISSDAEALARLF